MIRMPHVSEIPVINSNDDKQPGAFVSKRFKPLFRQHKPGLMILDHLLLSRREKGISHIPKLGIEKPTLAGLWDRV